MHDTGKKASQPGWDYVVDTGFDPSKAPIQPTNKKRTAKASVGDTTAKQNNLILKRLTELDKDNTRDVHVPVPNKTKDSAGRTKGKTAATRKILAAQKTFANYLADEEALAALEPQSTANARSKPMPRPSSQPKPKPKPKASTDITTADSPESTAAGQAPENPTVPWRPAMDGTDDAILVQSIVPSAPSEALMDALCSAAPLSYNAARVGLSTSGRPPLHFCEVCGYWGKVKCLSCGSRVCGLVCKRKHDVECQKYGGR